MWINRGGFWRGLFGSSLSAGLQNRHVRL